MAKLNQDHAAVVNLDLVREYAAKARRFRMAAEQYVGEPADLLRSLSETLMARADAVSSGAIYAGGRNGGSSDAVQAMRSSHS